jgi:hypothetical protein
MVSMTVRMKKLKSSGIAGAAEGYVARGREFDAANEQRARELEEAGLAVRLVPVASVKQGQKVEGSEASETGPLPSVGGKTGEDKQPSSLPADHRPKKQTLSKSKAKQK